MDMSIDDMSTETIEKYLEKRKEEEKLKIKKSDFVMEDHMGKDLDCTYKGRTIFLCSRTEDRIFEEFKEGNNIVASFGQDYLPEGYRWEVEERDCFVAGDEIVVKIVKE